MFSLRYFCFAPLSADDGPLYGKRGLAPEDMMDNDLRSIRCLHPYTVATLRKTGTKSEGREGWDMYSLIYQEKTQK